MKKSNLFKLICFLMTVACMLCSCGDGAQQSKEPSSSKEQSTQPQSSAKPVVVKEEWQAVPFVSQRLLDLGYTGGEGCQWPLHIVYDEIDGKTAFIGTDIGGMMRSTDEGKTWQSCTIGFGAGGATGIAVDPTNANRVLAVGVGSAINNNGLYLSTDGGDTWTDVKLDKIEGGRDYRCQIAFDPTSYDKKLGGCKTVYWSCLDDKNKLADCTPGLYKSTDGGKTWAMIPNSTKWGSSEIKMSNSGVLYLMKDNLLYKSTDQGVSFKKVLDAVTGFDVVKSQPNNVYACCETKFYVSKNSGDSFALVSENCSVESRYLSVSNSNPDKMVIQGEKYARFYSHDGGATWNKANIDKSLCWAPFNPRESTMSYHPTKDYVLGLGGDTITRSTDGGVNYIISAEGLNLACVGGPVVMNVNHPEFIYAGNQDYNGGFSTDGGKTWTYLYWKGEGWGGWTYGGYVLSEQVIFTAVADKMNGKGNDLHIAVTYDGGRTYSITDLPVFSEPIASGCLGDDNVAFLGEWRTDDGAKTWHKMEQVKSVHTMDPIKGTLFGIGADGISVWKSDDKGATWTRVRGAWMIKDIAYDHVNRCLYVCDDKLHKVCLDTNELISDIGGLTGVKSVVVDPNNTDNVYIAREKFGDFDIDYVMRSTDGGKNWVSLTRRVGDGRTGQDGAKKANFVRVNYKTSELFVACGCRGLWKIAPPQK